MWLLSRLPVLATERKAMMDDFALLTGGKYVQEELGDDIKEVTLDMLGQAEKVTIRKDRTLIVGGAGDKAAINERLDMLHTMLKKCKE